MFKKSCLALAIALVSFPALAMTNQPVTGSGGYAARTVGTSSAQVLAVGQGRTFLDIKNESTTETIACSLGGTAAINTAGSITIPPQWHYSWDGSFVPADAVNCISSAAATPVTVGAY